MLLLYFLLFYLFIGVLMGVISYYDFEQTMLFADELYGRSDSVS